MHTVGKSASPVAGDTQLRKTKLWSNIYDLVDGRDETADFIIRSHAHEYRGIFDENSVAIILPALKLGLPDSDRYARRIEGYYSVGFVEFDFSAEGISRLPIFDPN